MTSFISKRSLPKGIRINTCNHHFHSIKEKTIWTFEISTKAGVPARDADPFPVAKPGERSYRALKYALPGVEHFYAVKSNAEPQLIKLLAEEGASFDVCTNGEIDIVKQCGIKARSCLHTHPIKRESDIRYALEFGIDLFLVDNEFELEKNGPLPRHAQVLVRMSIQNPGCLVNLSQKFGVVPTQTFALIAKAPPDGTCGQGRQLPRWFTK